MSTVKTVKHWLFIAVSTICMSAIQAAPPKTAVHHLNQLSCSNGQIAKFNDAIWYCAEDTSAVTECGENEALLGDGSCVDAGLLIPPTDIDRFVDNGDGTITDNTTGLMWIKMLPEDGSEGGNCDGATIGRDVRCENNYYSWTNASDGDDTNPDGTVFTHYLATLNQDATENPNSTCFANYCDWRIPRLTELRTIVTDPCEDIPSPPLTTSPCVETIFYPTPPNFHWSSTSRVTAPEMAWVEDFLDGSQYPQYKSSSTYFNVRAVRGSGGGGNSGGDGWGDGWGYGWGGYPGYGYGYGYGPYGWGGYPGYGYGPYGWGGYPGYGYGPYGESSSDPAP